MIFLDLGDVFEKSLNVCPTRFANFKSCIFFHFLTRSTKGSESVFENPMAYLLFEWTPTVADKGARFDLKTSTHTINVSAFRVGFCTFVTYNFVPSSGSSRIPF